MPRASPRGEPHGETRGASFPRRAAKILCPRFAESSAPEKAPGGSREMQVPRPRARRAVAGARRGPALVLLKTSQVILTQALYGAPQRIPGGHGTTAGARSPAPRRREERLGARPGLGAPDAPAAARETRAPGTRAAEPAVQDPAADTCLHLPPGAGAAPTWPRSPRDRLWGRDSHPVLTGAEAMGGAVGTRFLRVGETGGRRGQGGRGDRAAPGTVCPERRRLPVTTTTAAQSNPVLQAWPAEPRDSAAAGDSPASASWRAGRCGVRGDHTPKPTCINSRYPQLDTKKEGSNWGSNDTDRRERIVIL